jgi:hypothetical protein
MRDIEHKLSKVRSANIRIEDHGIPFLDVQFDHEDGYSQGLGVYTLDGAFVFRFMLAMGVSSLADAVGKSCWVDAGHSSISAIYPLHKKDGQPFIIKEWQEWMERRGPQFSASEMRTGEHP